MFKKIPTKLVVAMALSLSAGAVQAAQIAVNGGFETGDFTGWAQYPSGGTTQTIITSNTSSGTYAANVNIPVGAGAVNNVLKQERIGGGLLSAGQTISVSFDFRGSAADGGVLFLENFTETLVGPPSHQDLSVLNPNADSSLWTTFAYDYTLGSDVSGGYTLQFAAVCGASNNCFADYYFDNISITADVNAVPVPAAVWLFGSGLLGLVGVARKKKAI